MTNTHWQNKSDWTKGPWQKNKEIPLVDEEHRVDTIRSHRMGARLALLPLWDETLPEEMLGRLRHPEMRHGTRGFFKYAPGMPSLEHLTAWEELNRAASLLADQVYGFPIRLRQQLQRPSEWELEIVGYVADGAQPNDSWMTDACIRNAANWVITDHTLCFRPSVPMDRRCSVGVLVAFVEDCCAASPWVYAKPLGLRWANLLGMTDAEYKKEMLYWKTGEAERVQWAHPLESPTT